MWVPMKAVAPPMVSQITEVIHLLAATPTQTRRVLVVVVVVVVVMAVVG